MKVFKYLAPEFHLTKKPGGLHLKGAKIRSSNDGIEYLRQLYGDDIDIYESGFLLFLNRANNVIGHFKISQGGVNGTIMDPRIIVKAACDCLASNVMICHNHPSGNTQPSRADEELTRKIKEALLFVDVRLIDHVILTSESHYSFADEGMI